MDEPDFSYSLLDLQARMFELDVEKKTPKLTYVSDNEADSNVDRTSTLDNAEEIAAGEAMEEESETKEKNKSSNGEYYEKNKAAILEMKAKHYEDNKEKQAMARKKKREDMTMWD